MLRAETVAQGVSWAEELNMDCFKRERQATVGSRNQAMPLGKYTRGSWILRRQLFFSLRCRDPKSLRETSEHYHIDERGAATVIEERFVQKVRKMVNSGN